MPTGEEIDFIKLYLEIPFLLDILEDNINKMKAAEFRLGDIFLFHMTTLQDRLSMEHFEVRRQMRNRGIKVFDTERTKIELNAKYICRGYTGTMTLLMDRIKADLRCKLCELMGVDIDKLRLD